MAIRLALLLIGTVLCGTNAYMIPVKHSTARSYSPAMATKAANPLQEVMDGVSAFFADMTKSKPKPPVQR